MARTSPPEPDGTASPLWPLTVILGDVARRLERQRATTHTETSPETRTGAGADPAAPGQVS